MVSREQATPPPRGLSWLRSGYGVVYTVVMSGAAVVCATLGNRNAVAHLTRAWSRHLCAVLGIRVEVEGAQHLDPAQPYLLLANHQSHVDILALFEALPMQPGFIAKQELRRIPFFGRAMALGGHVFVDRSTRRKAVQAIQDAADQVRERQTTLVIFPEGTRGDGEQLKPFKRGAVHLAKRAEIPIVPVGIRGTAQILGKHQRRIHPGRVQVCIGEPMSADKVKDTPVAEVSAILRGQVAELAGLRLNTKHVSG